MADKFSATFKRDSRNASAEDYNNPHLKCIPYPLCMNLSPSLDLNNFGIFNGWDSGIVCMACKELRKMKGNKNPATLMKRWAAVFNCCKERQLKDF